MRRVLFVNSGILGHRTVARLFRDAVALLPGIEAHHIDLSDALTFRDRALRRLLSLRLAPPTGPAGNLDVRRWRQELNVGLLASRRIRCAERTVGTFDLLHLHPQAVGYASRRRMRRTPTIISIDATQQQAAAEVTTPLSRAAFRPGIAHDHLVFRAAAAVTATSEWVASSVATHYPDCVSKLHVLPYPVGRLADPGWIERRRSRPPSSPVRVLFMGGDFPRKGGFDLLEAWRGGGFAARAVLTLVTDWTTLPDPLPPGVEVVRGVRPYTAAWTALWRDADLFVMPSRHEAFGMVFQEAASAAVPVVATRINAVPEIVQHGTTGLLVAPGDRQALGRALASLIDSKALRDRFAASALDHARTAFGLEVYATRFQSIVRSIQEPLGAHRH